MRQKKIRGHKRRHKQIDMWRLDNVSFDLNHYLLNRQDRCYAKIRVHPWSGITITNSEIPAPKRKTKQKILNGLFDIYENWKNQLDKSGQAYYLKIWLFEPRFSQSQVVCAMGDNIDFYDHVFSKSDFDKVIRPERYGKLRTKIAGLIWNHRLDEAHYDNTTVGEPETYASMQDYEETKNWFVKLLKKPHHTHKFKEPIGDMTESYAFKRGDIWLGGKE